MACPRPRERPHPLGVLGCRAICQAAVWGLLGCNMQHGGPRAAPSCLPSQGPSRNLLLNGKSYPTKVRLIRGGSLPPVKRRRMNWIDAPDDVFYMATEETRWGLQAGGVGGQWGSRVSLSLGAHSALTGRFASCSHPRRPSVPPAGPISPSPCARARPCRCGRPHPRRSTTSRSSLRTRCPSPARPPPPTLTCPETVPGASGK